MASRSNVQGNRKSHQAFSSALSSAAAEWLLILLLYVDGFISYLVRKLARCSKLQTPCLLCSRLDNILGCEWPEFYKDLICHAHKLEISSLACCHVHQELADIRGMCEGCLLSFAAEKKSNSETYRSLVRNLERNLVYGGDSHLTLPAAVDTEGVKVVEFHGEDVAEVPLLKNDRLLDSLRTRYCSCCNEPFHNKLNLQGLLQTKSIGHEVVQWDDALMGQDGHDHFQHQERSNKKREKSSLPSSPSQIGNHGGFDHLPHVGYTRLKITSYSESEVPLSDDDDGNSPVGTNDPKDLLSQSLKPEPAKSDQSISPNTLAEDDRVMEKIMHGTTLPEPSHLITPGQLNVAEHHDANSSESEVNIIHVPNDLDWNEFRGKGQPLTPSKHVPQNKIFLLESEVSVTTQRSNKHPAIPEDKEISSSKSGEVDSSDAALVSSTTYVKAPKDMTTAGTEPKQMQTANKPGSLTDSRVNLNDSYKLTIGYTMNQPSPRNPSRSSGDKKLLLSQISATRGLEFPWIDVTSSPRVHGEGDDLKMYDASSTISQQSVSKTCPLERNNSGLGCLDVNEIEGESLIDHLKWQIESDRKSMSLLYKELEEERSASAIAANQAMAMITRLQEEKATMQMEALQYQRMMEEQAEYDQEDLQKFNDLLTEKEKEIQDLEAEIDSYKKRLGEESFPAKMKDDSEEREDSLAGSPLVQRSGGNKVLERNDTVSMDAEGEKEIILKDSLRF